MDAANAVNVSLDPISGKILQLLIGHITGSQ